MTPARATEPWESFAETSREHPPGATIRLDPSAKVAPTASAITLPELPYLPVAGSAGAPGEADFEVAGVLGEGGMGRVLLARQKSLRREVAIKVVKPEQARSSALDALLAEAVVTGSIEHPGVIPVHALGRDAEGRPVLVMKRVEGVSWRTLAKDPGHPLWSSIAPEAGDRLDAHLDILMAVCSALHCAHQRGVVHRDVKLDNVMIGPFGEVYVVDWGIATRAAAPGEAGPRRGALVGTPSYMAPEMVMCDYARIDARTDVYLLGATLHAVLTGQSRHAGSAIDEVLLSARDSFPFEYGPEIPAELAAIANRAMSHSSDARFPSALALRMAILSFRRHRGSIALTDEAAARLRAIPAAGDARKVHGQLTECRFGFMQALAAWPENAAAAAGLEACLGRMIEHELDQRDAEGARALLGELRAPRPDLAERLAALETELAAARAREARLAALERDHDISIGAGAQLVLVALLPALAAGTLAYLLRRGPVVVSRTEALASPAVATLVLGAGLALTRRRLSAISRKALATLVVAPLAVLLHRALVTVHGAPGPAMFVGDLAIGSALAAALAIATVPRFGWIAFPLLVGAVGITLHPEIATPIFAGSMVGWTSLLLLLWRGVVRK